MQNQEILTEDEKSKVRSFPKSYDLFVDVLEQEARSILSLRDKITKEEVERLNSFFEYLLTTGGQLVFTGVGKSAVIGMKLASTFCSLGQNSFFLHPTDALHGDLGRISQSDVVVLISKSGNTEELLKLVNHLDLPITSLIGLLGERNSPLAKECSLVLDCHVEKEACLINKAPTNSTTATLAIGDAMAIVFQYISGLSKEKFLKNHPGGLLGRSLRLKVKDLMVEYSKSAIASPEDTMEDVLTKMIDHPTGICCVILEQDLQGIIVDGDIKRLLKSKKFTPLLKAKDVMNSQFIFTTEDELAYDCLKKMEKREKPISVMPVFDKEKGFKGIIRLHDLLTQGLF